MIIMNPAKATKFVKGSFVTYNIQVSIY